jgi:hypothetical protein
LGLRLHRAARTPVGRRVRPETYQNATSTRLCQHPLDARPALPPKGQKVGRQVRRAPIQECRLERCPRLNPVKPLGDTWAFALPRTFYTDLVKVLTYHVVPGRLNAAALNQDIYTGSGKDMRKTVEGDQLTVTGSGHDLMVTDDKGNTAKVTIVDVYQSNGVIMVVDKVLMPN